MKVCFLLSDLRPSGGVDIVLRYAEALEQERGFEVDLIAAGGTLREARSGVTRPVRALDSARADEYDIAISTWWETTRLMWLLSARHRVAFLQSAEEYFYDETQPLERLGAALSLRAADGYVAVSSWLATLARELRPDARVELVPNGIDKEIFDGRRAEQPGGPLRVLVEGQPTVWFKGVREALRAVSDVPEPVTVTLACRDTAEASVLGADHVAGGLDPSGMAELYASTDVLVKLSSLEGLGLAPLEAFHHGVPCVVTPYGGHDDYVRHGENGFLVGFDDFQTVTRIIGRLARDGDLLGRLRRGAFETAAAWPSARSSSARFADALRSFEEPTHPPLEPLLQAARAAAEQDRPYRGALAWHEAALAETRGALDDQIDEVARLNDLVAELEAARKDLNQLLLWREAEIDAIKASRAYRAALSARSLLDRVRG